ncbi:MAG: Protein serine/threonine phosphatase PrpC, regulation of stationary phase [Ktedonobacterales bacterium]|jgi:serine/threonine protein phosphatase PrpC|nr:MAG: Protein serine/threonine phosphatase PrpC, regulation of stationary phase [Ktedonobacterales bacterium]
MGVWSGRQRGLLVVALLLALGGVVAFGALPAQPTVRAAGRVALATPARPAQAVAYARIAVVRVLTYYNGAISSDTAPIPWPSPCASDGALVGTTGTNLNSFNYVLTPTAAVNPIQPCQGVQVGFAQLNGRATGWSISHIDVLLDAAYTGTDAKQMGTVRFAIDPAQITTNGGPFAPTLLALPLAQVAGSPTHDLPALSVPQPSDAPADPAQNAVIDLTRHDGQPLGRDALTSDEIGTTLYPISAQAADLNALPAPTAVPTAPSQQNTNGGTVVPATKTPLPPTPIATPGPLSAQIGLGAPEIDANGRLVGMVISDSQGHHVLASLATVTQAIGPISGKPGTLMTGWQQGIAAYYANPPDYTQAASAFDTLLTTYPDFGGAALFQTAAHSHSAAIPSLTTNATVTPPGTTATPGLSTRVLLLLGAVALVALVALVVALALLLRRRRTGAPAVPPEEAMLDLLPRDMPLEALDYLEPRPMPAPSVPLAPGNGHQGASSGAAGGNAAAIENAPTVKMPTAGPAVPRARRSLSLTLHAAGVTNPGIKRANDPNQDNILALRGVRVAEGRPQTYGLCIVADGMGGHLHGQEASKLTIEIVTNMVMQGLSSAQPLDETALKALLGDAVRRADNELRQRNQTGTVDMGTTLTAALVVDDVAYIANVGDSRTYIMSPESGLRRITSDHSVVAQLAAAGVIRPDDVYTHPRRNQIFRSLGGEQGAAEVDLFEVSLQAGDKLLLCSDGLWEMVRDPQMESILRGTADPRQAAEILVREANTNGGEDNIGVIVARMVEEAPQPGQVGAQIVVAPEGARFG